MLQISKEGEAANSTVLYNPLSLSELQYLFPDLTWMEYINNILAPAAQINHDDEVSVPEPHYLRKTLRLLKHTDKRLN